MYSVEFSKTAEKLFDKLDSLLQLRITSVLDRIKVRPFHHVKSLSNTKYYRLRVGDYRLVLDILQDKKLIYVIDIGHRRNIYK